MNLLKGYSLDCDLIVTASYNLISTNKHLNTFIPGRSRKRGMMKYELHLPLVMLANRNLQRGPACGVDPQLLKADLKAGLDNLKEALDILSDEPEGSFESKIVEGSKGSVSQLEDWVKTVSSSI
jgi:hypothetical protein